MLLRLAKGFRKGFDFLDEKLHLWCGGTLIIVFVLLSTVNVVGRYVFNMPIVGTVEYSELMVVAIVGCIMAYTQAQRRHIYVTMFSSSGPRWWRSGVAVFISLLGLIVAVLFAWQSVLGTIGSFGAGTELAGVSFFPFRVVLTVGFIMLAIVFLLQFIDSLRAFGRK